MTSDIIYIEILVEDVSGGILIENIMKKYISGSAKKIQYRLYSFKGIGRLPKANADPGQIKTRQILTDLPMYLKGFDRSLSALPYAKAIFVIVDNDRRNCKSFKLELARLVSSLDLDVNVFCCLAVEEIEAWLLGDHNALLDAYPEAKKSTLHTYRNDSIVGTWEVLADAIHKGGSVRLRKDSAGYYEIGKYKCEWADKIGSLLNIRENKSPSFRYFISKLDALCS
jgi:hypothetical protein